MGLFEERIPYKPQLKDEGAGCLIKFDLTMSDAIKR